MRQFKMEDWRERLEEHLATVLFPSCERSQQRKWGGVYARGLLLEGGRKSAGAMAGRLPDGNEQALQQFISQSTWEFRSVRERLARRVISYLPKSGQILIDDTGFPKHGKHSVGVARQYSGSLDGVGNCQVGVSIHYATPMGSLPLDFELYLPEVWTDDPRRCAKAGVPEGVGFRTKWRIALDMLERARTSGLTDLVNVVIGADAGYGNTFEFRQALTASSWTYIVGVNHTTVVWVETVTATKRQKKGGDKNRGRPTKRYAYEGEAPSILEVAESLPTEKWQEVTWRDGVKGRLTSRFAALRVQPAYGYYEGKPPHPKEWLLIEWPEGAEKPIRYWLSTLPEDMTLPQLVEQAKMRWQIEQNYQQLKDELGLDHFEGRSWIGWHRHVTMTMVAYGFLVVERLQGLKKGLYRKA